VKIRRPRALLQRLADAIGTDHADEPGQRPDTAADTTPDAPAPAEPVRGGARLPHWREPKKPLTLDAPAEPTLPRRPAATLVDDELPDDTDEDLVDADDEDDQDGEDDEGGKPRRRFGRRSGARRIYARPTYLDSRPSPKQSALQWWLGLSAPARWGLYNGTAAAAGFALHVVQFFHAETAYLVAQHHSWTNPYVCIWYGVAAGLWVFDYKTRAFWPLFALAARIPLASAVVGVLLYGSTDLPS
jgi:hypothetical protein